MRSKWMLVFLVLVAVAGGACDKITQTVNITSPSSTTISVVTVTSVTVVPVNATITLTAFGGVCSAIQQFSASVLPANAYQAVYWESSGGNISSTGLFIATSAGTYTIRASSAQDYSVAGTTTINVNAGNCAGGTTSGPTTGQFAQTGVVDCTVTTSGAGERNIGFSWTPSANASSYTVEESYTNSSGGLGGPTVVTTVNTTSVTLIRRRTAWQYRYRVSANGLILWSNGDWSAPCQVMADPAPTPPPVTSAPPGDTTPPGGTTTPPPPPGGTGVRTIQLVSSSVSGAVNATQNTSAVCRVDGVQVSCTPWWLSSDPSRVGVNPISGQVRYIFAGSASVCVQWSATVTSPVACLTFTTQ